MIRKNSSTKNVIDTINHILRFSFFFLSRSSKAFRSSYTAMPNWSCNNSTWPLSPRAKRRLTP